MTRKQRQMTVLSTAAVIGVAFFFALHPHWNAMTRERDDLADKPPSIDRPLADVQGTTRATPAGPGPLAPAVAAAASGPKGEGADPQRIQAAHEAFLKLLKTWESKNATPLKGTPGADAGVMIIMHLPPVDEAFLASANRLLDEHGIPENLRTREFFERTGLVGKNRYIGYQVNPYPADPAGSQDSMWIAYMGNTNNISINPLTGALTMTPDGPGDRVSPINLQSGRERYSHLFSFSTAE